MKQKKIELVVVEDPDEIERKNRIKNLVSDMICGYVKEHKKAKPDSRRKIRIQRQLQKIKRLLEHDI